MRKFIAAVFAVAFTASAALAQSQQAPTLRIVSEDGNRLPSELMYGNTKVKPLRLRPGTNVPITIDDSDFFVQQHYVDFLSRFPDQSGFAFWQNDINQCGSNPTCVEVHRVNVSAAFFLSIEYQRSSYTVYKTYKAAFGDLPGKPVPVRRENLMPDSRSISNNVVVGTPNWETTLDNNINAYLQAFVQRGDFQAANPSTNAAQFVDGLFAHAVVTPTAGERTAAITAFGSGNTAGRAAALRSVVESGTLHQAEFNKAFVLAQYFGYLKRNPDDLPDTTFAGYSFWLGKLNEFNGNFQQAEMVKAFINSTEYRTRF
ncbi:MAG: hypothetical protein QOH49_1632 [Acidobacteriota bacterium]|jgi:hypothetical protein|nr:hypothetical protein [Acidobacteriota bacterium]